MDTNRFGNGRWLMTDRLFRQLVVAFGTNGQRLRRESWNGRLMAQTFRAEREAAFRAAVLKFQSYISALLFKISKRIKNSRTSFRKTLKVVKHLLQGIFKHSNASKRSLVASSSPIIHTNR